MNDHQHLTDTLSREAEQFTHRGGTELHLDQVLARAGEIKRGRRMRASILMAAAVLAVAVPATLVASHRPAHEKPQPAAPTKVDTSPLSLDGLRMGDPPRNGYLEDGALHRDGYTYSSPSEQFVAFALLDGGALVATRDEHGNQRARLLDDASTSWPMQGGFAVAAGGNVAAFVEPDGTPVVVQGGGTKALDLPRIPRGSGFTAVAASGVDCWQGSAPSSCAVWVQSNGERPETWLATVEGVSTTAREFRTVADVRDGDVLAGVTELHDDLSTCSAVETADRPGSGWKTCAHRLLAFSPDDKRVLAAGPVADGAGDTELAVLDSQSGKVELDLKTENRAVMSQLVWEDDDHLLAVVQQGVESAIVRIGLDGSREYAVAPQKAADAYQSPFVLPGR